MSNKRQTPESLRRWGCRDIIHRRRNIRVADRIHKRSDWMRWANERRWCHRRGRSGVRSNTPLLVLLHAGIPAAKTPMIPLIVPTLLIPSAPKTAVVGRTAPTPPVATVTPVVIISTMLMRCETTAPGAMLPVAVAAVFVGDVSGRWFLGSLFGWGDLSRRGRSRWQ